MSILHHKQINNVPNRQVRRRKQRKYKLVSWDGRLKVWFLTAMLLHMYKCGALQQK
jgi:hypothetical protein